MGHAVERTVTDRRRRLLVAALGTSALLMGCASRSPIPLNDAGQACFRFGGRSSRNRRICTPDPVPGPEVEVDAKRFASTPGRLTIYVVRQRWSDGVDLVDLRLDASRPMAILPESFIRLRVPPGEHRLSASWRGGTDVLPVSGAAAEVVFVELIRTDLGWNVNYRLQPGQPEESRRRAAGLRLVADLL